MMIQVRNAVLAGLVLAGSLTFTSTGALADGVNSGKGGPIPLLGATVLGQAVAGAAGAYALWRRRRRNKD